MQEELLSVQLDDRQKARILAKVNNLFRAASDNRAKYDRIFQEIRDAYFSFTSEQRDKRKKNMKEKSLETISYALCFSDAEQSASRFITSIFSQNPYVVALPRTEDDIEKAQAATDLLDFQQYRDNLYSKYFEIIKYMSIYGTAIYKVFWDIGIDSYINSSPLEMPRVAPVSIFNFYPDPMATDSDNMRYCFEVAERDLEWVIQMVEKRIYRLTGDEIDRLIKSSKEIRGASNLGSGTINFGEKKIKTNVKMGIPFFDIREYVGWMDIEGNGNLIQTFITTLDNALLLRVTPNPYGFNPYIAIKNTRVPGEFYGVGEVEPIIPIQNVISDLMNVRLRNVNLIVNRMFKVLKGSGLKVENISSLPGRIFRVRSHQDIEPIPTQDVTQSSYIEVNQLLSTAQRILGNQPQNLGIPVSKRQTGLEVATLADFGSSRDRAKLKDIETMGITRHARFMIELYKKFLDEPISIRILENEAFKFQVIDKFDLSSDFDFISLGSNIEPLANKAFRQKELVAVYQIAAQDPTINRRALLKMILKSFDIKNISEILPPLEQVPQAQAQPRIQDIASLISR